MNYFGNAIAVILRSAWTSIVVVAYTISSASAATYTVELVTVEDVTVLQLPVGSHIAGNMEVKIKGGFVLSGNPTCSDRTYITTLKSVDADKRMFALLIAAQATKQKVTLYITDEPAYAAFPGRCSLYAVSITSAPAS